MINCHHEERSDVVISSSFKRSMRLPRVFDPRNDIPVLSFRGTECRGISLVVLSLTSFSSNSGGRESPARRRNKNCLCERSVANPRDKNIKCFHERSVVNPGINGVPEYLKLQSREYFILYRSLN